jgi:hypothetical protein
LGLAPARSQRPVRPVLAAFHDRSQPAAPAFLPFAVGHMDSSVPASGTRILVAAGVPRGAELESRLAAERAGNLRRYGVVAHIYSFGG